MKSIFISTLLIFYMVLPVSGETVYPLNADKQFEYASSCFSGEYYLRAAEEFNRFAYFFPEDKRTTKARFMTGVSYFKAGKYESALRKFRTFMDQDRINPGMEGSYLMASRCYLAMGEVGSALTTLNNLILITDDQDMKDAVNYTLGWVYLEDFWKEMYPSENSWLEIAKARFLKISSANRQKFKIGMLFDELDKTNSLPRKIPLLAGALSIVPGGGQVYCERYQDALAAFALNTGFILAAAESFDNENFALGGLITIVGLGFYAGNIYGAVSDAHKYNRRINRYFVKETKEKTKVGIDVFPTRGGAAVFFKYTF